MHRSLTASLCRATVSVPRGERSEYACDDDYRSADYPLVSMNPQSQDLLGASPFWSRITPSAAGQCGGFHPAQRCPARPNMRPACG